MSSLLRSFAAGLGFALGLSLVATAGPTPTPRIASVNFERTLSETPAGKRASETFDKLRQAKSAELEKQQKDLQKQAAELDKLAATLKPDVLAQKKSVLEQQFRELQTTYLRVERSLAEEQAKVVQELIVKAAPVIDDIAKAQGVDVVLDQHAVVWSAPTVDITDKVDARMK